MFYESNIYEGEKEDIHYSLCWNLHPRLFRVITSGAAVWKGEKKGGAPSLFSAEHLDPYELGS